MRSYLTCLAAATALVSGATATAQQKIISVYSSISSKACITHINDDATGANTRDCPGIQGFRLHIFEDDERSSVSVITPGKRVSPLNYWNVVTSGFSTLGDQVEWRVAKTGVQAKPIAIIVRVNTLDQSDPEHPKRVPLLAVAKISHSATCITRVVNALAPNANHEARRFAEEQHLACLSKEAAHTPPASSNTARY